MNKSVEEEQGRVKSLFVRKIFVGMDRVIVRWLNHTGSGNVKVVAFMVIKKMFVKYFLAMNTSRKRKFALSAKKICLNKRNITQSLLKVT